MLLRGSRSSRSGAWALSEAWPRWGGLGSARRHLGGVSGGVAGLPAGVATHTGGASFPSLGWSRPRRAHVHPRGSSAHIPALGSRHRPLGLPCRRRCRHGPRSRGRHGPRRSWIFAGCGGIGRRTSRTSDRRFGPRPTRRLASRPWSMVACRRSGTTTALGCCPLRQSGRGQRESTTTCSARRSSAARRTWPRRPRPAPRRSTALIRSA